MKASGRIGGVVVALTVACGAACGDGAELVAPLGDVRPDVVADVIDDLASTDSLPDTDVDDGREVVDTSPRVCEPGCFACEPGGCDPIVDLAVSGSAACVALASGDTICWGRPVTGALGLGLAGFHDLPPLRVDDRPPLVALGLAVGHACGRDTAGAIWCWGATYYGVTGVDARAALSVPEPQGPLAVGVDRLVVGPLGTACVVIAGVTSCWGLRMDGVESDEVAITRLLAPEPIADLVTADDVEVGLGAFAACAWSASADVLECWGANGKGQLGAGADIVGGIAPRPVKRAWDAAGRGPPASISALTVGHAHACVVADRGLWCWGELDQGTTPEPILIEAELPPVHALAAGRGFTCAVLGAERSVRCWGLAAGVAPALDGVVEIAAASDSACARTAAPERVACWRRDREAVDVLYTSARTPSCIVDDGYLAAGDDHPDATCQVCAGDGTFVPCPLGCADGRCTRARSLAAGDVHTCALDDAGDAWCWGPSPPARVADQPPLATLTAGGRHTCAVAVDGRVGCWGEQATFDLEALRVEPRDGALDVGRATTCAIVDEGVVCWGFVLDGTDWTDDTSASIGRGASGPTPIDGLAGLELEHVAVAEDAACVSERGRGTGPGRVYCWGLGAEGQLARPVETISSAALLATSNAPYTSAALVAGRAHVLVASGGGTQGIYGWGANDGGQLASTNPAPVTHMIQLIGGWSFNARALAAGDAFSCALEPTGRLTCWGSNMYGQLGPGVARGMATAPIEVPRLGPLTAITAGARHTCTIDLAGFIHCWGDNRAGQLGGGAPGIDFAPEPRWVRAP